MSDVVASAYVQLFSVGLLWISFHCVGMCGPLVTGLDVAGVNQGASVRGGLLRTLLYQSGRAVTYGTAGMMAGLVGHGAGRLTILGGGILSVAVGVLMVVVAWRQSTGPRDISPTLLTLSSKKRGRRSVQAMSDRVVAVMMTEARALAFDRRPSRAFFLGAIMGLLPCMIPLWALGLAATTGSPVHGALVMFGLVAMTTPLIVGVSFIPRFLKMKMSSFSAQLPRVLLAVSGVWMATAGLAAMGVIPHAHIGFMAFGRHNIVMFF